MLMRMKRQDEPRIKPGNRNPAHAFRFVRFTGHLDSGPGEGSALYIAESAAYTGAQLQAWMQAWWPLRLAASWPRRCAGRRQDALR